MKKYRSRATVEAAQFTTETIEEIVDWVSSLPNADAEFKPAVSGTGSLAAPARGARLVVRQYAPGGMAGPKGAVVLDVGDWLVRRQGRFEKVPSATFTAQYEEVKPLADFFDSPPAETAESPSTLIAEGDLQTANTTPDPTLADRTENEDDYEIDTRDHDPEFDEPEGGL